MKQILTLLLAVGTLTSAQAQSRDDARRVILGGGDGGYGKNYPSDNGRDVILGGGNNGNNYPNYPNNYTSGNNRQYQVDQINREYNAKVQSIRNNPYLSNSEKQRSIRQLENDRQRRLQQVNSQYSNGGYNNGRGNNRNNDCDDDRNNRGWTKNNNRNWKNRR